MRYVEKCWLAYVVVLTRPSNNSSPFGGLGRNTPGNASSSPSASPNGQSTGTRPSLFGHLSTVNPAPASNSLFGSTTSRSSGLFGATTSGGSSLFGSSQTATGGLFGTTSSNSPPSLIGNQPASGSQSQGLFGSLNNNSQPALPVNTGTETSDLAPYLYEADEAPPVRAAYQTITFKEKYLRFSVDELRVADYARNKGVLRSGSEDSGNEYFRSLSNTWSNNLRPKEHLAL